MITHATPVIVGRGHDQHIPAGPVTGQTGRTLCGHWWTAEGWPDAAVTCTRCIRAYVNNAPRTLRVRVTLTVTVDRDAYALAYGTDAAESIRDHVRSTLLSAAGPEGIFAPDSGIIAAEDR